MALTLQWTAAVLCLAGGALASTCPFGAVKTPANDACCKSDINTGTWFRTTPACCQSADGLYCYCDFTQTVTTDCKAEAHTETPYPITTTVTTLNPPKLCPTQTIAGRIVDSSGAALSTTESKTCRNGLVALYKIDSGNKVLICQAALIFNAASQTRELQMTDACSKLWAAETSTTVYLLYNEKQLELDDCMITNKQHPASSNGIITYSLTPAWNWKLSQEVKDVACQDTTDMMAACVPSSTMRASLDFSECVVLTYGKNDNAAANQLALTQEYFRGNINFEMFPTTCSIPTTTSNRMCFTSTSVRQCGKYDSGAPMYCKNNGQWILRGYVADQTACDNTVATWYIDLV